MGIKILCIMHTKHGCALYMAKYIICIMWQLIGNAESRPYPRTFWLETAFLLRSPGDLHAHSNLKSKGLGEVDELLSYPLAQQCLKYLVLHKPFYIALPCWTITFPFNYLEKNNLSQNPTCIVVSFQKTYPMHGFEWTNSAFKWSNLQSQ